MNNIFLALERAAKREHKTKWELAAEAILVYLERLGMNKPIIGLFADQPELIDTVTELAMQLREQRFL